MDSAVKIKHRHKADYPVQPWKNGLGKTREIAIDGKSPFRWRLSCAKLLASGPFSSFPGYDRTLVILPMETSSEEVPLILSHDGNERKIRPMSPHLFAGEAQTSAVVKTPCEDFNIFIRRGEAKSTLYPACLSKGEETQFPLPGSEHFLFVVDGTVETLEQNTNSKLLLQAHDCLSISRTSKGELLNLRTMTSDPNAICLWVIIHL
jgi:uncharacterized protein